MAGLFSAAQTAYGIGSTLSTAVSWVTPSSEKGKAQYIDPIAVLCHLAILNFRPVGTKLHIRDGEISNDHPNFIQGIKRAQSGAGNEDHHNITTGVYYAVKWIKPTEDKNKDLLIIFELALKGLYTLKEGTYKGKEWVRQSLHFGPYNILNKGIKSESLAFEEEAIPDWQDNAIAQATYHYWTEKPNCSELSDIAKLFEKAVENDLDSKIVEDQISKIKEKLSKANSQFKQYHETMKTGKTPTCPLKALPKREKEEQKSESAKGKFAFLSYFSRKK